MFTEVPAPPCMRSVMNWSLNSPLIKRGRWLYNMLRDVLIEYAQLGISQGSGFFTYPSASVQTAAPLSAEYR